MSRTNKFKYVILHKETYRGFEFQLAQTSLGVIGCLNKRPLEYEGRGHFCRYMTEEERERQSVEDMRQGIDRMINNHVIYRGDLRDQ